MPHASIVQSESSPGRQIAAAFMAILVGIGLSRFAYSPLIPAVIEADWFSPLDAAYLGAANLVGYLIGALGGRKLAVWTSPQTTLRGSMLTASAAFLASALPLSFAWFFLWRLISGISGGVLMVLAAPTVLPSVPSHRRGFASGVIFAGVGLGIILSGTLVPTLLRLGLPETWYSLGALCLATTGMAWSWWPKGEGVAAHPTRSAGHDAQQLRHPILLAICASYGLIAVGLVPHMIFLVDFVARGLGQGIPIGGFYWLLFGLGALVGPLIAGRLADRLGFGLALRTVLVLHIGCAALPAFNHSTVALTLSSIIVGSAVSGTVPLVLGQTHERVRTPSAQKAAWSLATATFALGQAGGGYAYSYLFARTEGDFSLLFRLGAAALCLALLTNTWAALSARARSPLLG